MKIASLVLSRYSSPFRLSAAAASGVLAATLALFSGGVQGAEESKPPAAPAVQLFPDDVLAKGKGLEVRRSEVDSAIAAFRAAAAAQNQTINEGKPGELEGRMVDRLILNKILLLRATPEDKAKAKESAEKVIVETKRRAGSDKTYQRQLLGAGMQVEDYEKRVFEQAVYERVLEREVRSALSVTPEQLKAFYNDGIDVTARDLQVTVDTLAKTNPDTAFFRDGTKKLAELKKATLARLERPEQVRASHILLYIVEKGTRTDLPDDVKKTKRELIGKLIVRLKAGEDFTKLAKEFSEDPDVQQTGGEYTVPKDANMAPELKTALFALPVNQISDMITTVYGYHVAKVHERIPAGKIPFDKAEKDIREFLLNQEMQKRLPAYVESVKKEYGVEVMEAKK